MNFYFSTFLLLAISNPFAKGLPASSYQSGFDLAYPQPLGFWECAHSSGFEKIVIEGFREACNHDPHDGTPMGGGVPSTDFNGIYWAARNEGKYDATQIDTYMFPCTDDKLPCVSPDEQIKRFTDHLTKYGIEVNTIWLDIEPHDDTARGGCRGWMWPPAQNKNLSAQWITAIRNDMQHSTRQWGIYAPNTENKWQTMFGDNSYPIAPDLPLWVVQTDGQPGLDTYSPHIGGWGFATAKQYKLQTSTCNRTVDLDTFAFQYENFQVPSHKLGPQSCKTTVDGLRYRTCQYTSADCIVMGQFPLGTMVYFTCETTGEQINGNWNTSSWGKTADGFFVSLAYVDQSCAQQLLHCSYYN